MTPVIFNHSAAIDDFVATALLLTMPNIELLGVIVTNADCIAEPAMQASWKVHRYFGIPQVPLALSDARGWNPFPWEYRGDCLKMGAIGVLRQCPNNASWPPYPSGEELLRDLLEKAVAMRQPVTILATGPLTTIANVVRATWEFSLRSVATCKRLRSISTR